MKKLVLSFINSVGHLSSLLKSMEVETGDFQLAMAVLNVLSEPFSFTITALDALSDEDSFLEVVMYRPLQYWGSTMTDSSATIESSLYISSRSLQPTPQGPQRTHCEG